MDSVSAMYMHLVYQRTSHSGERNESMFASQFPSSQFPSQILHFNLEIQSLYRSNESLLFAGLSCLYKQFL